VFLVKRLILGLGMQLSSNSQAVNEMQRQMRLLVVSLITVLAVAGLCRVAAAGQVAIENETFSPGLKVDGTKWLVNIVTIRNIPGDPNLVMKVPCLTTDPSAATYHASEQSYENYGCTAQKITSGPDNGLMIDQHGQVFALPPE
jgi:hypothetical protein